MWLRRAAIMCPLQFFLPDIFWRKIKTLPPPSPLNGRGLHFCSLNKNFNTGSILCVQYLIGRNKMSWQKIKSTDISTAHLPIEWHFLKLLHWHNSPSKRNFQNFLPAKKRKKINTPLLSFNQILIYGTNTKS